MNNTSQIENIIRMEEKYTSASQAVQALSCALENYIHAQADLTDLARYYHSPEWLADYDADNRGELPQKLKRGILSEDAIYNLLSENDELIRTMTQLAEKHYRKL